MTYMHKTAPAKRVLFLSNNWDQDDPYERVMLYMLH